LRQQASTDLLLTYINKHYKFASRTLGAIDSVILSVLFFLILPLYFFFNIRIDTIISSCAQYFQNRHQLTLVLKLKPSSFRCLLFENHTLMFPLYFLLHLGCRHVSIYKMKVDVYLRFCGSIHRLITDPDFLAQNVYANLLVS